METWLIVLAIVKLVGICWFCWHYPILGMLMNLLGMFSD